MGVETNAKQLADSWLKMAKSVEPEMRSATLEATRALWAVAKLEMRRGIYDKPVPTRKSGKPQWRRTGNLRRSERYRMLSPYVGIVSNDAAYSKARHDMQNTRFPAQWRTDAIAKSETMRRGIYTRRIRNLIAAGRIRGVKLT